MTTSATPRENRGRVRGGIVRSFGRTSDLEFLPASLEIIETPPSTAGTRLGALICAMLATSLAWGWFGRLDVIAVAQGKFQPTGRVKLVQPADNGRVRRILATNGQHVAADEVLVELDQREAGAEAEGARAMADAFRGEAARRRAALAVASIFDGDSRTTSAGPRSARITVAMKSAAARPDWPADLPQGVVDREARILRADLSQLRSQVAGFEAQAGQRTAEVHRLEGTMAEQRRLIAVDQDRVDMKTTLFSKDAGSRKDVLDATESIEAQKTTLAQEAGQLEEARAGQAVVESEVAKAIDGFVSDNATRLGEAERQAADQSQKLAKAEARLADMTLRSPIDGTVQASALTSPGQVVTAGEEVMRVVPSTGGIEVEAYMPNHDIGFVHEGESAVVKVESFPFTRYGTLRATVVRVARDAVPEPDADRSEQDPTSASRTSGSGGAQRVQNLVFPVTLKTERSTIDVDGTAVPVTAGMAATVEVRTGSRRILEYLLSPIAETISEGLHER